MEVVHGDVSCCYGCKKKILDGEQYMSVNDHMFHNACFNCKQCTKPLAGVPFQFKAENYMCRDCYIDKYCETCRHCEKKITSGGVLPALGGFYHPKCFVCKACREPFPDGRFVKKDGHPYHAACAANPLVAESKDNFSAHFCGACQKLTTPQDEITIKPGVWYHQKCLQCTHCKIDLDQDIMCKDDQIFCREDYINIFMNRCTACGEPITGQMAKKANDERFHPDCMTCFVCGARTTKMKGGHFVCVSHLQAEVPENCCQVCADTIADADDVVRAVGKTIHKDCFFCQICGVPLNQTICKLRKHIICCDSCVKKPIDAHIEELPQEQEDLRGRHMRARSRGVTKSSFGTFQWEKGGLLGQGAFGKVYLGILPSKTTVAVKCVYPQTRDQTKAIEREIEVMCVLRHPHIVTLLGVQSAGSQLEIIMEYVKGCALDEVLKKEHPLPEGTRQSYVKQMLSALVYCHGKNIIHRDIKGNNILVTSTNSIKVCDFGSAALLGKDVKKATEDYDYTPLWTAPEILTGEYDRKVDIWSLGCVVIELVSGSPPWSEMNFENAFSALFTIGNTTKLPAIPDSCSEPCRDFILQCLNRDPNSRPDALDLLNHRWIKD